MKRPLIISVIFIAAVAVAFVFLLSQKSEAPAPSESSGPRSTEVANQDGSTESIANYVDYSEDALVKANGQRVIFFHAPWCPQCRAIEADILEKGVPEGFTILKVDYDSNQALRQKYGVTLQTTFVKVDATGNLQSKYVAYDEPNLAALENNFLQK